MMSKIIHYDDTEISDALREVLDDPAPFRELIPGATYSFILSRGDEPAHPLLYLIEDYAPLLFDEVPRGTDLHRAMLDWVTLSYNYIDGRSHPIFHEVLKKAKKAHPRQRGNRSEDKVIELFKKKLQRVAIDIGCGNISTPKGKELLVLLKDAYDNPKEYIPKQHSFTPSRITPVREYLTSLKLSNKTKVIGKYIDSLKSL